jgi:type IV secretory pathway VirB2 component (pilin)
MRVSRGVNMNTTLTLILLQAGGSPWENAVQQLQVAFTGPIAKGLSLVAIVVGGLMFAFGEGGNKRMFAGIVFGIGMAIAAANFLTWLFPGA